MTVVYVDSVFTLNAVMDYLVLAAAAKLSGISLRRGRYLLAALFGGAYAVAVFLPGCAPLGSWLGKIAAGAAMAAIAFLGQRRLLRLTLLVFGLSCALAGCVLALALLTDSCVPMAGGVFYTDVDARVLLLAAGGAYLVLTVVFRAAARHAVRGELIPVRVGLKGKTVALTALCDTGNTLRDPVSGSGVLVVFHRTLQPLWPEPLRRLLTERRLAAPADLLLELEGTGVRFRLLPYSAVGVGGGLLLAFRSDWAEIGGKRMEGLPVALSPTELGIGYSALWGMTVRTGGSYGKLERKAAAATGAAGTASGDAGPLYRGQRHPAPAPVPGAGGGAAGVSGRRERPQGTDRT